jgi:hypothetical protein
MSDNADVFFDKYVGPILFGMVITLVSVLAGAIISQHGYIKGNTINTAPMDVSDYQKEVEE